MVAVQTNRMRKSTLRNSTARVLVLGHHQAGKSAAIVRYTTGRFIQNYCSSTNDWLYRHPVGYDPERNQYKIVELLEQKDIEFSNSVSREDEDQQELQQGSRSQEKQPPGCSLSSRVALDRQIDHEFYETQQLLTKLHWANAYVILYALNDSPSFNKAIKYLNLIANEVNRQPTNHHSPARRPVLLVANKRDLTHSVNMSQRGRRVSLSDGRLLAMRHQCLFLELSISESAGPIEQAITNLVDSIRASELHTTRINSSSSDLNEQILTQTQLTYWIPSSVFPIYEQHNNQHNQTHSNGQQPVWSTLVKTRPPQSYSSVSQNIVQSSCLAIKAKRLNEADFRLLTPVGMSLSSGSSSSTSSSPAGSLGTASSALVKLEQPQVAAPLLPSAPLAEIVQRPAMGAIESIGAAQCTAATRPSLSSNSPMSSVSSVSNSGKSHLSSFRSSFRKGALAIVGSRSLAGRVTEVGGSANKENGRKLATTATRSSLSSIPNQDSLSWIGHTASDSDTSSGGTIGTSRQQSIEREVPKKPPGQRINWIRSKISSLGRQETSASGSDTSSIQQQSGNEQQQQQAVGRFRRSLFKYRTRRKTVAFEPTYETNESPSCGSLGSVAKIARDERQHSDNACLVQVSAAADSISSSQTDLTPKPSSMGNPLRESRNNSFNVLYKTQNSSGAQSSSSLSTSNEATAAGGNTVAATESVFIVDGMGSATALYSPGTGARPEQTMKANWNASRRNNSHSTLSRGSTSGGSYDEDSELEVDHRDGRLTGLAATRHSLPNSVKREATTTHTDLARPVKARCELVKTLQSTLTNLAKTAGGQSSPSVEDTQAAKRSFCTALFSRNSTTMPVPVTTDRLHFESTTTVGTRQMAEVEHIRTLPLMGFCK